jgi:hypothetical protein
MSHGVGKRIAHRGAGYTRSLKVTLCLHDVAPSVKAAQSPLTGVEHTSVIGKRPHEEDDVMERLHFPAGTQAATRQLSHQSGLFLCHSGAVATTDLEQAPQQ